MRKPLFTNAAKVRRAAETLRAVCHPLRLEILDFINQESPSNVNSIYTSLGLEQSITSQHLAILRKAGLVKTERNGKFINYRINAQKMQKLESCIQHFMQVEREREQPKRLVDSGPA